MACSDHRNVPFRGRDHQPLQGHRIDQQHWGELRHHQKARLCSFFGQRAEAKRIYSQSSAGYIYGSGGGGGSPSTYVNTGGYADKKGNFRSSTLRQWQRVGSTVIYAPRRKK